MTHFNRLAPEMALVSGFARSFPTSRPIANATITALENEQLKLRTDLKGQFGPFPWPIGQPLTLVCEKPGSFWSGFTTTQTATLIVPPEGLNDPDMHKNISFQVPSHMSYKFLSLAMGVDVDSEACQIAATITPPNITLNDCPQGVEGVTVSLSPDPNCESFYFGIIPFFHKTNPFTRRLKTTSLDGGVVLMNVPEGDYLMEAKKGEKVFSTVRIKARKGILVNASPPHGPTLLAELKYS